MARSTKATTSVKPTHNLFLKYTAPSGKVLNIGYVGLFANSKVHQLMLEELVTEEAMRNFIANLSGEILEYGETSADSLTSLF